MGGAAEEVQTEAATSVKPGTMLTKEFKGQTYQVKRLAEGFEYEGELYKTLTALARKITGYKDISGPAFFGLGKEEDLRPRLEHHVPAENLWCRHRPAVESLWSNCYALCRLSILRNSCRI